ncbi:MAG TPA: lysozyme inhibitor LprI family protein [Chthoniobacteraceae bacterium]|jgi:uncharacterized protein YecT (DUF1311 family)|nr:lysozyme inhibitor LprI family protein [Chthoniobacteraceae bacterium]
MDFHLERRQSIGAIYFATALTLCFPIISAADKEPTLAEARAQYKAADAELNKAYAAAIAELHQTKAAALREDERNWIQYRDEMVEHDEYVARSFGHTNLSDEKDPDYWTSLAAYEEDRTQYLHGYSGKHVPPGIPGEYDDSYGGTAEVRQTKSGIEFSLEAVRHAGHDQGEISGVLKFKGDTAYFRQNEKNVQSGDPPCELVFTIVDGHVLRIEEKVRDSNAGINVHYDGDYYKIGKVRGD